MGSQYEHWTLLQKTQGQFLAPNGGSQLTITLVPEDPTLSPVSRHQAYMWYTHLHAGKISTDIKYFFLKKLRINSRKLGMVAHIENPSPQEAEGEGKGRKGQGRGRKPDEKTLLLVRCMLSFNFYSSNTNRGR